MITKRQRETFSTIGLGAGLVGLVLLLGLGVGAGARIVVDVSVGSPISAAIVWSAAGSLAAGSVFAGVRVVNWMADDFQRRVATPGTAWAQYLGAAVGGVAGITGQVLGDDPIMSVAVTVTIGLASTYAASVIEKQTARALISYALILLLVALILLGESTPEQRANVVQDTRPRDLLLLVVVLVMIALPPVAGLRVKARRNNRRGEQRWSDSRPAYELPGRGWG
jgi:hypothetical protein